MTVRAWWEREGEERGNERGRGWLEQTSGMK